MIAHVKPRNTSGRALPCNYAALVGAALGVDPVGILEGLGLSAESFQPMLRGCKQCGATEVTGTKRLYCADCLNVTLVCDVCGKAFQRLQGEVKAWAKRGGERIYCGRKCHGTYAGQQYGFIAHPENTGAGRGKRYSDEIALKVVKLRATGMRFAAIGKLCGMSEKPVWHVHQRGIRLKEATAAREEATR